MNPSNLHKNKNNLIINTKDGSKSLWNSELDETYHSRHGALQESLHVFIESGLAQIQSKSVVILEFGFGTGLNALLSFAHAQKYNLKVHYLSIDNLPLNWNSIKDLEYQSHLVVEKKNVWQELVEAPWGIDNQVNESFVLKKIKADFNELNNYNIPQVDLIYYDAFGSRVQPELWTFEHFSKVVSLLKLNGIIVTYSAKGSVRRAWQELGLEVERIPGPPGKREMLRGTKKM